MKNKLKITKYPMRIFYFYKTGELVFSTEQDNSKLAIQEFLSSGFSRRDVDCVLSYSKKDDSYKILN